MIAMSAPGFVVGSLATRFISDMMGRRATVLASALPFACGTVYIFVPIKNILFFM